MRLYSAPVSLFARKVEIALHEKSIPFERIMVPFTQERGYQPKHPDVLANNPKGQVPVLIDGDLTLYDSTVILEYLEDAHPSPPLYPIGAAPRARCRQLEMFADEILLPPVRLLMHRTARPDPDRHAEREAAAVAAYPAITAHYATLSAALGAQDYLCGALSVADIAAFVVILYALRLGGPGLVETPNLRAWYTRLLSRSAFGKIAEEIAAADREISYPVKATGV